MNEIEKINDELRNYKLFKIQRANTRKQEFDEVKNQIFKTKKHELLNYFFVLINLLSIPFLIYNILKSLYEINYYDTNKTIIILNFFLVVLTSLFISYKLVVYIKTLKQQLSIVENAIHHFSNESEVLKGEYETYVNNYLEKNRNSS
jgi:uncharacterized protein with PQ loop repeat